jgi:hypothetical protein
LIEPNLSEGHQRAVIQAAQPLPPVRREVFYAAVAHLFQGRADVGDGELFRTLRELQREHLR